MKTIVFGASGQDGYYLRKKCQENNMECFSVSRSAGFIQANIANYADVQSLISKIKPDYIFHLAANSSTKHDTLFENHETIATGTLNILEVAKKICPNAKIFIAGSGVQFENKGQPISETDNFDATSPYAIARIQSVYAARYYRKLGLATYIGYLFHHESPLRKPRHISQMIISFAKKILEGHRETITLSDIQVQKEWTFAGDVVDAMFTLVDQDTIFEAVIGSGISYSIKEWLALTFNTIDKDWKQFVILGENFIPEYKLLVSKPETIFKLGWKPQINFEALNQMMMNLN